MSLLTQTEYNNKSQDLRKLFSYHIVAKIDFSLFFLLDFQESPPSV